MSWAAGCKPKIENKMKRIVLIAIMTMFLPMNTQAQTGHPAHEGAGGLFSHSGSNTRAMARQIAEATGGDLSRISGKAWPRPEYGAVVDQAKKEIGGVRLR